MFKKGRWVGPYSTGGLIFSMFGFVCHGQTLKDSQDLDWWSWVMGRRGPGSGETWSWVRGRRGPVSGGDVDKLLLCCFTNNPPRPQLI